MMCHREVPTRTRIRIRIASGSMSSNGRGISQDCPSAPPAKLSEPSQTLEVLGAGDTLATNGRLMGQTNAQSRR
jgi:hypothetical protein